MYVSVKQHQLSINGPLFGIEQLNWAEGIGGLAWPARTTVVRSNLVCKLNFILFG